jgi:ADP-ribosylglycohydrolase
MKNKIRGMMFGVAVGDALGQPYENGPALGYPVKEYKGQGGQTTDDWQMTAALARALMKANGFNMDAMVKEHVAAFEDTTRGWGGAHRDACAFLKKGISPTESGKMTLQETKPYRGRGNGMCMKISPLAAYHHVCKVPLSARVGPVGELTIMTHATSIGLASALGMEEAVIYCLSHTPDTFDTGEFLRSVKHAVEIAEQCVLNETGHTGDKMSERIAHLGDNWSKLAPEDVAESYKGGGYAYESLPFSLAFFCMGKHDAGCVYDCVGSGGDTDTNGSMVAALAGALHGEEIFSKSLLYKLVGFPDIELLSGQFADWIVSKQTT